MITRTRRSRQIFVSTQDSQRQSGFRAICSTWNSFCAISAMHTRRMSSSPNIFNRNESLDSQSLYLTRNDERTETATRVQRRGRNLCLFTVTVNRSSAPLLACRSATGRCQYILNPAHSRPHTPRTDDPSKTATASPATSQLKAGPGNQMP